MEYVESVEKRLQYRSRNPYKIQYDHIFIDDDNRKIVLLIQSILMQKWSN